MKRIYQLYETAILLKKIKMPKSSQICINFSTTGSCKV